MTGTDLLKKRTILQNDLKRIQEQIKKLEEQKNSLQEQLEKTYP